MAQILASGLDFADWERRLPSSLKQTFSMLAIAQQDNAYAFSFRLDDETAAQALRHGKGPTDYLSQILRYHGLKDLAFTLEFIRKDYGLHIHGVAIIHPDKVSDLSVTLRAALAKNFKERGGKNPRRAIDIQPITSPGGWVSYCQKELELTKVRLRSNPFYASQSSRRAGKSLYEGIRSWLNSETLSKTAQEAPGDAINQNSYQDSQKPRSRLLEPPRSLQSHPRTTPVDLSPRKAAMGFACAFTERSRAPPGICAKSNYLVNYLPDQDAIQDIGEFTSPADSPIDRYPGRLSESAPEFQPCTAT